MKSQSYRLKDSHIINIGETGNDILTRIRGKFTGNKRSDWNKMARSYDLQVKFRSNQKKVKGASPHPHILECVELADFKLHHGQLPLLNAIKGKKIKHRDGDPAPRDRASVIIRKWAADNK